MQNRNDRWQYVMVAVIMAVVTLAMVGIIEPGAAQAANFGSLTDNGTAAYMGIGIAVPLGPLHIYSTTSTQPETIDLSGAGPLTAQWNNWGPGGASSGTGFLARFSRGTKASPADVQVGDRLGFNVFGGMAGGVFKHTAAIEAVVDTGTVSGTSLPTYLRFSTTSSGTTSRVERMRITGDGSVGIGITGPSILSKLHVLNYDATTGARSIYGQALPGVYNADTYGVYGDYSWNGNYGYLGGKDYGVYGKNVSGDTHGSLGSYTNGVEGWSYYNAGVSGSTFSGDGVYGYANSGHAGHFDGAVYVNGTLYVEGTKHFITEDPADPAKIVCYASLEGPEAGTYIRGSAELVAGRATIQLPDHFFKVTAEKGLTVQFTPVGRWLQLYTIEKTTSSIVVGEATGQSGSFDYVVNGIRKGYEDYQVVRDRKSVQ